MSLNDCQGENVSYVAPELRYDVISCNPACGCLWSLDMRYKGNSARDRQLWKCGTFECDKIGGRPHNGRALHSVILATYCIADGFSTRWQ